MNWLGAGRGSANPPRASAAICAGQAGGGRAAARTGDGGDPRFAVAAADYHARDDECPRGIPHERQRPKSYRPGSRPGHVAAALDSGQAARHLSHRRGVGQTAGKLDAQGDAAPSQAEALVLPQEPVAARSSEQIDVHGIDAGSLTGEAGRRGREAGRRGREAARSG